MLLITLTLLSAVSFLFYGVTFFTNSSMKVEFERYKLQKFRNLVGYLQLLGGIGLLVGLLWETALVVSSGGLALLMLIGFGVRIKMRDGFLESLPSLIFMLLNSYIFFVSIAHFKS